MNDELSSTGKKARCGRDLFLLHVTCFLLVVCYVNMFQFWAWLSRQLGPGLPLKMLPVIATLAVLLVISLRFIQRVNRGCRIKVVFLGLGIVTAFLALAIPDPHVPVKRIHVPEYIILSFLVRYTLSHRLEGLRLTLFTALVTALYGVHDEMLQGLHPLRYYGWRDIVVNAVAGLSGALLGHGLICFEGDEPGGTSRSWRGQSAGRAVLFAALLAAVVWQVLYLYHHLGNGDVFLAVAPVTVCAVMIAALYPKSVFGSRTNHGLQAVFWLSLGLVVYPVIAGLHWVEFL